MPRSIRTVYNLLVEEGGHYRFTGSEVKVGMDTLLGGQEVVVRGLGQSNEITVSPTYDHRSTFLVSGSQLEDLSAG